MTFQAVLDDVSIDYRNKLVSDVSSRLLQARLSIAVCESITAGQLGEALTIFPGGSQYFLGGMICYSNALKVRLAQVSPATIQAHGVVSAAVTEEMVTGVQRLTGADIVIATNGVAGPTTLDQQQVGMVYLGFRFLQQTVVKRLEIEGNRTLIRHRTTTAALGILKNWLLTQSVEKETDYDR